MMWFMRALIKAICGTFQLNPEVVVNFSGEVIQTACLTRLVRIPDSAYLQSIDSMYPRLYKCIIGSDNQGFHRHLSRS